jgi:hypothetical protein
MRQARRLAPDDPDPVAVREVGDSAGEGALVHAEPAQQRAEAQRAASVEQTGEEVARLAGGVEAMQGVEVIGHGRGFYPGAEGRAQIRRIRNRFTMYRE